MNTKAKILTVQEAKQLRYPIPESMIRVVGLLKGRKINGLSYQKQIRKEWDRRLKRQIKLALSDTGH